MSEAPHLLVDIDGPIIIATLNRPDRLNAMTLQMMQLFEQALHRFRDSPELKVMLIRATGRYFCAGADLKQDEAPREPATTGSAVRENHRLRVRGVRRIYDEMEHIEKPIVVAHHAMCVGGGLELSLSCDFRLAAKSAGYAFPEGKFGVLPASNGVSTLTRVCGTHWARWLIMANKQADADMAYNMGLIHQVFPDETFEQEVMDFCQHLAKNDSEQMGAAKIAIEMARDVGRDMARQVERLANSALMIGPKFIEKMASHIQGVGGKNRSNEQSSSSKE
jgi:enoyl-CoA hydratase/carnithine racemase